MLKEEELNKIVNWNKRQNNELLDEVESSLKDIHIMLTNVCLSISRVCFNDQT